MTETSAEPAPHTYTIQRHTMRLDWPLTFSDGERVVAVLSSEPVPIRPLDWIVTVLVELPANPAVCRYCGSAHGGPGCRAVVSGEMTP